MNRRDAIKALGITVIMTVGAHKISEASGIGEPPQVSFYDGTSSGVEVLWQIKDRDVVFNADFFQNIIIKQRGEDDIVIRFSEVVEALKLHGEK